LLHPQAKSPWEQKASVRAHLDHLGIIQPLAQHLLDKLEDLLQHHHHLETQGEVRYPHHHCHPPEKDK
jgi:hypothetical protein